MICQRCNSQNLHTDLRCIQCGASLVGHSINKPEDFAKKAEPVDRAFRGNVAANIGGAIFVFGFIVITGLMHPARLDSFSHLTFGGAISFAVGRFIGRFFANDKNQF